MNFRVCVLLKGAVSKGFIRISVNNFCAKPKGHISFFLQFNGKSLLHQRIILKTKMMTFNLIHEKTLFNLGLWKIWLASPDRWQNLMTALTAAFNQEKLNVKISLQNTYQNTCYFKIYFQLNIRKHTSSLVNRNKDQWCKEYNCVPITRSRVTQFIALQDYYSTTTHSQSILYN